MDVCRRSCLAQSCYALGETHGQCYQCGNPKQHLTGARHQLESSCPFLRVKASNRAKGIQSENKFKQWTIVRRMYRVAWVVAVVNIARLWSLLPRLVLSCFFIYFLFCLAIIVLPRLADCSLPLFYLCLIWLFLPSIVLPYSVCLFGSAFAVLCLPCFALLSCALPSLV